MDGLQLQQVVFVLLRSLVEYSVVAHEPVLNLLWVLVMVTVQLTKQNQDCCWQQQAKTLEPADWSSWMISKTTTTTRQPAKPAGTHRKGCWLAATVFFKIRAWRLSIRILFVHKDVEMLKWVIRVVHTSKVIGPHFNISVTVGYADVLWTRPRSRCGERSCG